MVDAYHTSASYLLQILNFTLFCKLKTLRIPANLDPLTVHATYMLVSAFQETRDFCSMLLHCASVFLMEKAACEFTIPSEQSRLRKMAGASLPLIVLRMTCCTFTLQFFIAPYIFQSVIFLYSNLED